MRLTLVAMLMCIGCAEPRARSVKYTPNSDTSDAAAGASAVMPAPVSSAGASSAGADVLPLRRLNRSEYANTYRDLLGSEPAPAELFSSETLGPTGFAEGGPMSPSELDRMLDSVDILADAYLVRGLDAELPCAANAADNDCARAFIESFGRRAYRHSLSSQEAGDLFAIFVEAHQERDFKAALGMVVRAALLSPRFNYRWELGDEVPQQGGEVLALNPYEVASRLSYFLWQSMPDAALFEAAAKGELATPALVQAQAQRMLADPVRGRAGVRAFFSGWLPLGKLSSSASTDPNAALYAAMRESSLKFVEELVLGAGDRRYSSLLGGTDAYVNESLASVFGISGVTGSEMRRVTIADPLRAGLFTQPAFLAATSDSTLATVVRRGKFVYEHLGTCGSVPPPGGVIPEPPPRPQDSSVREHLSLHAKDGVCNQCHQYMDPMGFAFDGFDSLGKARLSDDYGKPVDSSGVLILSESERIQFTDAAHLLRQLGANSLSLRCFADQVSRFALRTSGTDSQASRDAIASRFVAAEGDVYQLLLAATQEPAFYQRKPAPGEVIP